MMRKRTSCARPFPFPDGTDLFPATNIVNMMNQFRWSQDKRLSRWIRTSRLDGFGKVIAAVEPGDTEKLAILAKFQTHGMAAMMNLQKLAAMAG